MLTQLGDIIKTASSFLQTGVAPPNVSFETEQKLKDTTHLSSKKFFAAFSGFLILGTFFAVSIAIMFALRTTPDLIPYYVTMFTKTMEVFATIMAVYIGGQAVVDLRYNSSSNASVSASLEKIDITNRVIANEKEDDYSLDFYEN